MWKALANPLLIVVGSFSLELLIVWSLGRLRVRGGGPARHDPRWHGMALALKGLFVLPTLSVLGLFFGDLPDVPRVATELAPDQIMDWMHGEQRVLLNLQMVVFAALVYLGLQLSAIIRLAWRTVPPPSRGSS